MKKKKIIGRVSGLCICLLIILSNIVQATSKIKPTQEAVGSFTKPLQVIIGLFQITAVGLGAIMLIVLAIKYMTSAPGDKAEIKKHAIVYIVGACMAFGATGVVEIIKTFAENELN